MIKVVVKKRFSAQPISMIVDENTTPRQALENAGVDCSVGIPFLDGLILPAGDIDKTFADLGVSEKCWLINVIKAV